MNTNLRNWMERQTKRDYDKVLVTIAVDDSAKNKREISKPHYRRAQKQRTQDPDKALIKEIVREVVSEVMAQMDKQRSCETCPNRSKPTGSKKRTDPPKGYHYDRKPNGIEYR